MMNDFAVVLCRYLSELGLSFDVMLGYLSEKAGLVLYPLPGGKVEKEYMDGTREVALPFEIAVKGKDQEVIATALWVVNEKLSDFDLVLPSQNGSYTFGRLEVAKPFLNDLDEQGYYTFMLDVVAHLEVKRSK